MPEDILTDADIDSMLNATRNLRDAALIATLYETGCRRGELLSCSIRSLTFTANGARLQVTGKTGARVVPLVFSVPYLRKWLEVHPLRNDSGAPLWILSRTTIIDGVSIRDAAMTPAALTAILKSIAHDAGITKRINPHSFRHARATRLAGAFSEQQMKRFLGWTSASAMPAVYVHLSGRDIEDATLAMYGVAASKQPTAIQVRKCPVCDKIVSQSAKYCDVCGAQL
ncbi:MAG: site-specific integrase [Methanogenium sp.]